MGGREEFTIGLIIWQPFTLGKGKFPLYAYENALVGKIIYSDVKIEYNDPNFDTGTVETRQVYASLGLNF